MNLSLIEIKSLIKKRQYVQALVACDEIINNASDYDELIETYRSKASICSRTGDYGQALASRRKVVEFSCATLSDLYLCGDSAIFAGAYETAEELMENVIKRGEQLGEDWFRSGALFLLAYCQLKLKKFDEARENLNISIALDKDIEMPIPETCGVLSHQQLREEIDRQQKFN